MAYSISGTADINTRILILDESDMSVTQNVVTGSPEYEITTSSGSKIVIGRNNSGEAYGFSGVQSIYSAPASQTLLVGLFDGVAEFVVSSSSITLTKPKTYFNPWITGGSFYDVEFSPSNEYVAMGREIGSGTNRLMIYKYDFNNGTYTKLDTSIVYKAVYSIAWSPDNTYLAFTQISSDGGSNLPIIRILKREGDTFTEISIEQGPSTVASPYTYPTISGDIAWSISGDILIVPLAYMPASNTNRCWVYKVTGDTFSLITNPFIDGSRSSTGYGVGFSSIGHMALSAGTVSVYSRVGDQFQLIQALGIDSCYDLAFSPNGLYLAIGHYYTPRLFLYKWNGSSYTQLTVPSSPILSQMCTSVDWSSDGKFLATCASNSGDLIVYELIDDTLNPITTNVFASEYCYSVGFTKSGSTIR